FIPSHRDHPDLHSFPTRRSSDLNGILSPRSDRWNRGAGPGTQLQVDEDAAVLEDLVPHAVQFLLQQRAAPIQLPDPFANPFAARSEEHTSELQSRGHLVCRLLLE